MQTAGYAVGGGRQITEGLFFGGGAAVAGRQAGRGAAEAPVNSGISRSADHAADHCVLYTLNIAQG